MVGDARERQVGFRKDAKEKPMNELDHLKERLTTNPLFALSLGSRELFHSNFLAWLLENYPLTVSALTQSQAPKKIEVYREKYNFDLVIVFGEGNDRQSLIIEVKVKDIPSIEQLDRYDETAKKHKKILGSSPDRLLISLTKPPSEIPVSWRVVNLAELAGLIENAASACNFTPGHHTLIQYYIALCRDLTELVQRVTTGDSKSCYFLFKPTGEEASCKRPDEILDELRFSDTINKHRAGKLCEEMRCRSDTLSFSGFRPHFDHGFDRKQAHVGGVIQIKENPDLSLAVHLQGNQYRRMLSFRGFKIPSRTEVKNQNELIQFISETDKWKWMFGHYHENGSFFCTSGQGGFFMDKQVVPTSQRKNKILLSYAPIHVYQYTDIGSDSGVPTDRVIDAVMEDLQYAAELLSDADYVSRFREWSLRKAV